MYSVYFDNFDLSTISSVDIYNYQAISSPDRDLAINKLARADKSVLTTAEYSEKEITVEGKICGTDRQDTEATYAQLKAYVQQPNKILKLSQSNEDIEWTATLNGTIDEWFGDWLKFTLVFTCTDPIGRAADSTDLISSTNITGTAQDIAMVVGGSFKADPVFTVTVNTVTGGTNKEISIKNAQTGQGIAITRDWIDGDELLVNSYTKVVEVNGAVADYTGIYPIFYPGARTLTYVDQLTTRDVDISATYQKRYV